MGAVGILKNKIPVVALLLLLLATVVTLPRSATAISTESLDTLLFVLRGSGHSLLANSIATSDLLFDLLSLPSLTLLAPPDPSLFALDMTQPPPAYLSTLRLHVLPSSLDLNPNSSSSLLLPTLLPSRSLRLSFSLDASLLLDGVQLLLPMLHHSRDLSVFRLRGLLPSSSPFLATRNATLPLPPVLAPPYYNSNHDPPRPLYVAPSKPPVSRKMSPSPSCPPEAAAAYAGSLMYSPMTAVGRVPLPPASNSQAGPEAGGEECEEEKMPCRVGWLSDVRGQEEQPADLVEDYAIRHYYASTADYGF